MKFISTNRKSEPVSFGEALHRGLAPDHGLYVPEKLPHFDTLFFSKLPRKSLQEIAVEIAQQYIGEEIPNVDVMGIIEEALNFPIPLKKVEKDLFVLELYHGPTLAFKDVGARFMAGCLAWFNRHEDKETTVLVATSGDTGSAVAHAFLNRKGIRVVILYPGGKVSEIQEKQFTTLGRNILALEIDGTFDDCQRLVKKAFTDETLQQQLKLTSANSINIGRLLPQTFYYYYAWGQLNKEKHAQPRFCVPSGNLGNLTAGLLAKKTGLPLNPFVAATNVNKAFFEYLNTGIFKARPALKTLSNAMDVGDPSNLARINHLYHHKVAEINKEVLGFSADDVQTMEAMSTVYRNTGLLLDPHSSIGYLGIKNNPSPGPGIFLATAHPAKFAETVTRVTGQTPEIPPQLKACLTKEKKTVPLPPEWDALKSFLYTLA